MVRGRGGLLLVVMATGCPVSLPSAVADFDPSCLDAGPVELEPVGWIEGGVQLTDWPQRPATLHNRCDTAISMPSPFVVDTGTISPAAFAGVRIPGEGSSDVMMIVDPRTPGRFSVDLMIDHVEGRIAVPVSVEVGAARGQFVPSAIRVTEAAPGCLLDLPLTLRSAGTWALEVESLGDEALDEVTAWPETEGPWTLENGEALEARLEVEVPDVTDGWQVTLRPGSNHSYQPTPRLLPPLELEVVVESVDPAAPCPEEE